MKKNSVKLIIVIIVLLEGAYLLGLWGIVDKIKHSKPKLNESGLSWIWFLALENLLVQIPSEYSNVKVVTAQVISHLTLYLAVVLALFKELIASIKRTFLSWREYSLKNLTFLQC